MSIFDSRTAKVLTTTGVFVVVGAFLYGVRHTLIIILFAVFFAYLLEPLVMRIEKSKLARGSRTLAIVETYAAIGILLVVLGFSFGPRLIEDSRQLSQSLPGLIDKVTTGKIVWQFGSAHGWSYDTQLRIEQLIAAHRNELLRWSTQVGTAVASRCKISFGWCSSPFWLSFSCVTEAGSRKGLLTLSTAETSGALCVASLMT